MVPTYLSNLHLNDAELSCEGNIQNEEAPLPNKSEALGFRRRNKDNLYDLSRYRYNYLMTLFLKSKRNGNIFISEIKSGFPFQKANRLTGHIKSLTALLKHENYLSN